MHHRSHLIILFVILSLISFNSPGRTAGKPAAPAIPAAQTKNPPPEPWRQKWDRIVAEARKEGKAVAYGNFSVREKAAVSKGLKDNYGIEMEWVTGNSSQVVNRIVNERNAGMFIVDIFASGTGGAIDMLKPRGYLQKLDDAVILPEIQDPNVWLNKKFPWFDHDHTNIAFVGEVTPNLIANTDLVKEGELTSYQDLLNPRWKGKIVMFNPTISGTAQGWFTMMGPLLGGETYMYALVKQEPAILNDTRLAVEWVARGKVSIGLCLRSEEIYTFIKAGSPIAVIRPKEGGYLSVSHGTISLLKNAPHPNAAIVYLNYLLTKEGQTAYSKAGGAVVRRLDAPTDHLRPPSIPVPGRTYLDMNEDSASDKVENMELAKKIFAPLLK